jgi:hypothetical protein
MAGLLNNFGLPYNIEVELSSTGDFAINEVSIL